jgi:plastocyanin
MSYRLVIASTFAFVLGAIVAAQAAATITVVQRGLLLDRSSATVAKGDRIIFTNEDDVIHNIHIFGPDDYEKDLGLQKPGAKLSYIFDKTGLVKVRCNIHPSVKMTVTVK